LELFNTSGETFHHNLFVSALLALSGELFLLIGAKESEKAMQELKRPLVALATALYIFLYIEVSH
jgi:hypothetical protein